MTKLEMIELIALGAIVVALILFYTIKGIRKHWLKEIKQTLEEAIVTAEKTNRTGPAKKELVLTMVAGKCKELGIPYDLIKKLVDKLIEQIISNHNIIEKGR